MALGQRVLAIAYRKLSTNEANKKIEEISREEVESDLIFVGFLLLYCPIKTDSGPVISELWNSGNRVVMITGDAMHTAVEVARQVGIIRSKKRSFPNTLELKHFPYGKASERRSDVCSEFQFVSFSKGSEISKAGEFSLSSTHITELKKMVAERKIALCVS